MFIRKKLQTNLHSGQEEKDEGEKKLMYNTRIVTDCSKAIYIVFMID